MCARQAILIRDEISYITHGTLDSPTHPFRHADLLKKALESINDVIHSNSSYEHITKKGGDVERRPNPFKGMDAERRNKEMMATVKCVRDYLDKHYPAGERSRSEEWQGLVG